MMPKYKIHWYIGFGPNEDGIEADSQEDAESYVYELVKEDFESNVDYSAKLIKNTEED